MPGIAKDRLRLITPNPAANKAALLSHLRSEEHASYKFRGADLRELLKAPLPSLKPPIAGSTSIEEAPGTTSWKRDGRLADRPEDAGKHGHAPRRDIRKRLAAAKEASTNAESTSHQANSESRTRRYYGTCPSRIRTDDAGKRHRLAASFDSS